MTQEQFQESVLPSAPQFGQPMGQPVTPPNPNISDMFEEMTLEWASPN